MIKRKKELWYNLLKKIQKKRSFIKKKEKMLLEREYAV